MQLAYSPKAFAAERASWRAVIQLNLVRSINTILDAVTSELVDTDAVSSSPYIFGSSLSSKPPSPVPGEHGGSSGSLDISPDRRSALRKLKLRLTPLRQVEADLKARLGAGTEEVTEDSIARDAEGRGSLDAETLMATPLDDVPYAPVRRPHPKDAVYVRSHQDWKEKEKARSKFSLSLLKPGNSGAKRPASLGEEKDTATGVLAECREDMLTLWRDPGVREVLKRRKVMRGLWDSAE